MPANCLSLKTKVIDMKRYLLVLSAALAFCLAGCAGNKSHSDVKTAADTLAVVDETADSGFGDPSSEDVVKKLPANQIRNGFVVISEAVPDVILEIRYYSTYNFVGSRIDGYEEPVALMTKEAAKALKAVSDDVKAQGYRLKIYDAYRPARAVAHFCRWAKDADTSMKRAFYPNLDKANLFKQDYIASKSGHSRGSTVDLTLFDMKTGKEVDMGGTFDMLDPSAHPDYKGITQQQYENRQILRQAMMRHGFKPLYSEWWHFTLRDEPYPNTYFDFPVRFHE